MRCWECKKLIVTPDIIDGRKGHAGEVRRAAAGDESDKLIEDEPSPTWRTDGMVSTFSCTHCGTQYRAEIKVIGRLDLRATGYVERRAKGEGWD